MLKCTYLRNSLSYCQYIQSSDSTICDEYFIQDDREIHKVNLTNQSKNGGEHHETVIL